MAVIEVRLVIKMDTSKKVKTSKCNNWGNTSKIDNGIKINGSKWGKTSKMGNGDVKMGKTSKMSDTGEVGIRMALFAPEGV